MEIKKAAEGLHPLERKILPYLEDGMLFMKLVEKSGMKEVEVMRALQWLSNKKAVSIDETLQEVAELDSNGEKYKKEGLPERKFLEAIKDSEKEVDHLGLEKEEINVCIGSLKKKAAILINKKDGKLSFSITPMGKKLLKKPSLEEDFLKKEFPVIVRELKEEERQAFENLDSRKGLLRKKLVKTRTINLTDVGKGLAKADIVADVEERLTPEMLKEGSWKDKKFRRFDVSINVPKKAYGKKQNYRQFLDEVRRKFMSLGFKEMDGPIVESDFWDMDALFMPQFHSARDIHEAYYVKDPEFADIDEKIIKKVKAAHENGGGTGSKGWGYKFDTLRTKRNLLRTQGTACSARMLASKDLEIPSKYFAMARCFRYDVIDATHLPDFNQVEGIVVEEGLDIRHLFGLLQMFAKEFADTDEIKLVPAYFPFTEPSVELFAKHPDLGWIELGGAGIFRPELTRPLGVNVPVIAWGMGIDRIAMFKLGIKDIRNLFSHDLKKLRESKVNL
ncbi:phenylalanine--tRNA ligase subunit alpha [Candidatus Woesearchaeota archaeon]|nr:phenylalanine--tRNA ligase subunit alpha [Candidatus Woesearchaeota archaeon]